MLVMEFKRDEEQQLRYEMMLSICSTYAHSSKNPTKYKHIAEILCRRIRVVGPRKAPTFLVGLRRRGEYFNGSSGDATKNIVKEYIHRKVLQELKDGTVLNINNHKQSVHKQVK